MHSCILPDVEGEKMEPECADAADGPLHREEPGVYSLVIGEAPSHDLKICFEGSRIPVLDPSHIATAKPDYLLILPWNLTDEIVAANANIREWGGRFVVPIPEARVIE